MDMTFKDVVELSRMNDYDNRWYQPIWWIVAILVAIFFLWWCNKQGDGKADLAASISNLNGRLNTLEPVVKNNAEQNFNTARTLSGIIQGVEDIRDHTYKSLNDLDQAVFKSRYGQYAHHNGCGCNGGGSRFVQRSTYGSPTTTVEVVEECNHC